jgi:hypothetical protein
VLVGERFVDESVDGGNDERTVNHDTVDDRCAVDDRAIDDRARSADHRR